MSQTVSAYTVPVGTNVTFTATVTNRGPEQLSFTVRDRLPGALTFVSAPDGQCDTPPVGASGTVSCTLPILKPGSTARVRVVARAQVRGHPTNTMVVEPAVPAQDPQPANDSAAITVEIVPR